MELVGQGGHAVEFDALEGGGFGFGGQIGMGGYVPPPVFGVGGFGGCGFAQHLVGVDEAAVRGEQAGDLTEQGMRARRWPSYCSDTALNWLWRVGGMVFSGRRFQVACWQMEAT